jgi:hypothetical protein
MLASAMNGNSQVPLRPDDADVPPDLQALVEQCYRNGAYEGTLNYAADPEPPPLGADEVWADEFLHEKGLRPRKKAPRRKERSEGRSERRGLSPPSSTERGLSPPSGPPGQARRLAGLHSFRTLKGKPRSR